MACPDVDPSLTGSPLALICWSPGSIPKVHPVSQPQAPTGFDRTANVLGALALAVTDQTADAAAGATGRSGTTTTAAALSALHHFLDKPSVDLLRQVLGLTSSGTVRLVDRLEADGYVRRIAGDDGRTTRIALTAAGRRVAARVSAARAEVLAGALADLSASDRRTLDGLLDKVLAGFVRGRGARRWICRLCDTGVCWASPGDCPMAEATGRAGQDSPTG